MTSAQTAQNAAAAKSSKAKGAQRAPVQPTEAPKRGRAKPAAKAIDANAEQHGPAISQEQRDAERRATDDRRKSDAAMQFATQQMTTPSASPSAPAPKLETPPVLTAEVAMLIANAKALGLDLKLAGTAEEPKLVPANSTGNTGNTKAPRTAKDVQNGITRPGADTKCGMIFAACDRLTQTTGVYATVADLKMQPEIRSINDHTVKTQYARWRSYNGVTGRHVPQAAAPAQAPEAAPTV